MKRLVIVTGVIIFVLSMVMPAQAWIFGKKKVADETVAKDAAPVQAPVEKGKKAAQEEAAKQEAQKAREDKAVEEMLKAKMAASQKKMNEINNTEWQIELMAMSGKGKKEVDVVTFKDRQVSIASYAKKGFPTTNFTLTVQADGVSVWETMQTSEKAGVAFWRGEFDPRIQTMRGVVSYQVDKKTRMDYSFSSTAKKSISANAR